MAKKGLGKGLQALIPPKPVEENRGKSVVLLQIDDIIPNADQPRKNFDPDKLRELAESIKEHGIVQPLVVRPTGEGKHEIVVGERRWRAGKIAGCLEIPCIIKKLDKKAVTELALIENIQREDLNVMEEAEAYRKLITDFNYTQEDLALRLGKSRSYVGNTLRLLNLSLPLQALVRDGFLSAGHCRAILAVNDRNKHGSFAQKIIQDKLSVRQAEVMAKNINEADSMVEEVIKQDKEKNREIRDPLIRNIEDRMRNRFGTKVKIKSGNKGGKIEIEYYSEDDLSRIIGLVLTEETL